MPNDFMASGSAAAEDIEKTFFVLPARIRGRNALMVCMTPMRLLFTYTGQQMSNGSNKYFQEFIHRF